MTSNRYLLVLSFFTTTNSLLKQKIILVCINCENAFESLTMQFLWFMFILVETVHCMLYIKAWIIFDNIWNHQKLWYYYVTQCKLSYLMKYFVIYHLPFWSNDSNKMQILLCLYFHPLKQNNNWLNLWESKGWTNFVKNRILDSMYNYELIKIINSFVEYYFNNIFLYKVIVLSCYLGILSNYHLICVKNAQTTLVMQNTFPRNTKDKI